MLQIYSPTELARLLRSTHHLVEYSVAAGCNMLVVDTSAALDDLVIPDHLNTIVVGCGPHMHAGLDVHLADQDELEFIGNMIDAQPQAAYMLCQVLRQNQHASLRQGLLNESLAYSTLQHSRGFALWLSKRDAIQAHSPSEQPLQLLRHGAQLELTLNRPQVHNAYNSALRDALCEGLLLAHADPDVEQVILRGAGPSFCAGGDLSEFGQATDAAVAHISRTTMSAASLLGELTIATQAYLHGACIGAGIELPAYMQQLHAQQDSYFQLPEVSMGLIPGAGGTVSIPRRIGRQRTAWLALSNHKVDAQSALDWGLIDQII